MILRGVRHAGDGPAPRNVAAGPPELVDDVVAAVGTARHVPVEEPEDLVAVAQVTKHRVRPSHNVLVGAAGGVRRPRLAVGECERGARGECRARGEKSEFRCSYPSAEV